MEKRGASHSVINLNRYRSMLQEMCLLGLGGTLINEYLY